MYLAENLIIYLALATLLILAELMLLSAIYNVYKRYKSSVTKNK